MLGIGLSALLCTNIGWVLFDMIDHYISSYIIVGIVLLECISVGWIFEAETTAKGPDQHAGHERGLSFLGIVYWVPVVTICFYAHFGYSD